MAAQVAAALALLIGLGNRDAGAAIVVGAVVALVGFWLMFAAVVAWGVRLGVAAAGD